MKISVYTDGSFSNPYGGYGIIFVAVTGKGNKMRKIKSKKYAGTTNNRMELKAIIHALEHCTPGHQIDVYSDSEYCIKSINEWLPNWVRKGILESKENPDLWQRFLEARKRHEAGRSKLKFTWVRGHSVSQFNNMADKLANQARLIDTQEMTVECKGNN